MKVTHSLMTEREAPANDFLDLSGPIIKLSQRNSRNCLLNEQNKNTTIFNHLGPVVVSTIAAAATAITAVSTDHPHLASHKWGSWTPQPSWKGCKGGPRCCARKEGQNCISVTVTGSPSTSNNKFLQRHWLSIWKLISPQCQAEQHRNVLLYSVVD